jgi:hypothetical protein
MPFRPQDDTHHAVHMSLHLLIREPMKRAARRDNPLTQRHTTIQTTQIKPATSSTPESTTANATTCIAPPPSRNRQAAIHAATVSSIVSWPG